MRLPTLKHRLRSCSIAIIGAAFLLLMGGCPVDSDKLTTDVAQAALESLTASLVDTLSIYLAGN